MIYQEEEHAGKSLNYCLNAGAEAESFGMRSNTSPGMLLRIIGRWLGRRCRPIFSKTDAMTGIFQLLGEASMSSYFGRYELKKFLSDLSYPTGVVELGVRGALLV